jgi:2-dehydropantoate 2-reductase
MTTVCVAGVGAVGTTIAARLAVSGLDVRLLARGARREQLRRDGVRVQFPDERIEARLAVSDRPDFGIQDVLLVAAKSHALPDLLPTLGPLVGPDTVVVPLVNGIPWWYFQGSGGPFENATVGSVDPQGALAALGAVTGGLLAGQHLIASVVYMTATLEPSGLATVLGRPRLILGELAQRRSERADRLAKLFTDAGLETVASDCIRNDLWTKVALNLATNPLSVVTEATLEEQFSDPRLLPLVAAVIAETERVARGHHARFSRPLEAMLETGRSAGPFATSMLQDYRAGRRLELDAIAGSVLELSEKIGLQMPVTQTIVALCAHRAASRSDLAQ